MEKVRQLAVMCIGRAVLFGSLAIFLVMFSFSFDPAWAFRNGAIMTLVMAAILVWKAQATFRQNPKRTEVWMYLDEKSRPQNDNARRFFCATLREVYGRFAKVSLAAACLMFAASMGLNAVGFQPFEQAPTYAALDRGIN